MADYWVKHCQGEAAVGPYTGAQLEAMAASGQIAPEALVSADRVQWVAASNVKGPFGPEVAPLATPPPMAMVAPQAPQQEMIPDAVPAPLGYAAATCRTRSVQWFLICSIIIVAIGVVQIVAQFGGMAMMMYSMPGASSPTTVVTTPGGVTTTTTAVRGPAPGPSRAFMVAMLGGTILRLLAVSASLGLFVYFTVWAYVVHQDMRVLTNGSYPISPGRACGFCWIPLFNLYWIVYMPYKLAEAVDWHLGRTRSVVNPSVVLVYQILQLVVNFTCACFLSPAPIFIALSMKDLQAGMNELSARSGYVPPAAPAVAMD